MTKIKIWTPRLSEVNGQNIVTSVAVETFGDDAEVTEFRSGLVRSLESGILSVWFFFNGVFGVRDEKIYIVVSRSGFGFLRDIPCLMLGLLGRRVFCHSHGSDIVSLFNRRILGRLARLLYRNVCLIVPSAHVVDDLKHHGLQNIRVCENFYPTSNFDRFSFLENTNEGNRSAYKILWNSNILASKGFFEVCDAVVALRKRNYPVMMTVLGEATSDAEMSKYQVLQRLKRYSQADCIKYVGSVTNVEVEKEIIASDLVALPSTYASECQPLAIISAMVLNKMVMVTPTPALKETTRGYEKVAFVRRDPVSIGDKIESLLAEYRSTKIDKITRNKRAAKRFSEKKFKSNIREIIYEN